MNTDLTIEDVECLIHWSKGTKGHAQDVENLKTLLILCNHSGYGGIPRMAVAIEEIWRNPEMKKKYAAVRDNHLKEMQKYIDDMKKMSKKS